MLGALQTRFLPNKILIQPPDGDAPPIVRFAEYARLQASREGKATAYVCQNFACELPTTDVQRMLLSIGSKWKAPAEEKTNDSRT